MRPLHVWSGTWNVATNRPGPPSLDPLFKGHKSPPDIVSLGLQELISQLSVPFYWTRDALQPIKIDERAEPWAERLLESLLRVFATDYTLVVSVNLAAIGLLVVIRSDLYSLVSQVSTGALGSGLFGVYPNKGAVAVGLDLVFPDASLGTATLCLVSAHLEPHAGESHFQLRNKEIQYLLSNLFLSDASHCWARYVNDYETIILCGDLNYRLMPVKTGGVYGVVDSSIKSFSIPRDRKEIYTLIESKDIGYLLSIDELIFARLHVRVPPLDAFQEAPITFIPSYKYRILPSKSALSIDLSPSQLFSETRIPAYCDRILFKTCRSDLSCLSYTSITNLGWSDHQPVIGFFRWDASTYQTLPEQRSYTRLYYSLLWAQWIRLVSMNLYSLFGGILFFGYMFLA